MELICERVVVAATMTCLLFALFKGVLVPGKHYVAMSKAYEALKHSREEWRQVASRGISIRCRNCRVQLPALAKFCPQCGKAKYVD